MPHPEPQIYQGHLKSMQRLSYGQEGKSMVKFTVTHKQKKKVGDKMEVQEFDVEFAAFGVMAEKLEIGFKPGRVIILRYQLGQRTNGQYTNLTAEIKDLDIYEQVPECVEFMKNLVNRRNSDPGAYRPPTAQQSLPMNQARNEPAPQATKAPKPADDEDPSNDPPF